VHVVLPHSRGRRSIEAKKSYLKFFKEVLATIQPSVETRKNEYLFPFSEDDLLKELFEDDELGRHCRYIKFSIFFKAVKKQRVRADLLDLAVKIQRDDFCWQLTFLSSMSGFKGTRAGPRLGVSTSKKLTELGVLGGVLKLFSGVRPFP
jgi:hypothetical protein